MWEKNLGNKMRKLEKEMDFPFNFFFFFDLYQISNLIINLY